MAMRPILALLLAMVVTALPLAGCSPGFQASPSVPGASEEASTATALAATALPPAASTPGTPFEPTAVKMSTRVDAVAACAQTPDRIRVFKVLVGTTAYGQDEAFVPEAAHDFSGDTDGGRPQSVSCDLSTGVVTPMNVPVSRESSFSFDAGRLLVNGHLVDLATGDVQRLDAGDAFGFEPAAIRGDLVVGTQRFANGDTARPAVLDLRSGTYRVLEPQEIGVPGTWTRAVDVEAGLVVGSIEQATVGDPEPIWVYDLRNDRPVEPPPPASVAPGALGYAAPTAIDGGVVVGWAYRRSNDPQPFAWAVGEPTVTWLAVPADQLGAVPVAIENGLVVGTSKGDQSSHSDFVVENRGIVWDLASGDFLDLGVGPRALSGTLAVEAGFTPQSLVTALDGEHVLGFLGQSTGFYTQFGGTPVIWDISEWLTSIGR
jgi:hypothetical protein